MGQVHVSPVPGSVSLGTEGWPIVLELPTPCVRSAGRGHTLRKTPTIAETVNTVGREVTDSNLRGHVRRQKKRSAGCHVQTECTCDTGSVFRVMIVPLERI